MNSKHIVLLMSVALLGATSVRAADRALMRELQARVSGFAQAVNRRDTTVVRKHIPATAKFQLSDHHLLTAAEFLKQVEDSEKTVSNLRMAVTMKSAARTSGGAWGNAVADSSGRFQDSKGRWHRIETTERLVISWKRTPTGFQLERVTQVGHVTKIDGRVVARADRT